MEDEIMVIEQAILHITDIDNEAVICTDQLLDLSNKQVFDYVSEITERAMVQDAKTGTMPIEHELICNFFAENNFIESSKTYSQLWHDISRGIEMPTGDYLCVYLTQEGQKYIALIKLTHTEEVTHYLNYNEVGIENQLIVNRTILPKVTTKLKEAIIFAKGGTYRLIETKYKVEGKRQFYLGERFLKLQTEKQTVQDSLQSIKKIVKEISKDPQIEEYELISKLQEAVYETAEKGYLDIDLIEEKVFAGNPQAQEIFAKEVQEKSIVSQEINNSPQIAKKYSKQKFKLDNGIELAIPLEVYQDKEIIEFINEPDGTFSVIIKNIDDIKNKF